MFSWLPLSWGNSKHQPSLETAKTSVHEPVEPMTCRFGLSDITREGYSIVSSPNKMLSVILDAMGRVILVDNRCGIAIRMWKGYRDAQCGWIEVEEEKHPGMRKEFNKFKQTSQLRSALFLVIYAPKKGVIDIWSTQQGPKITTFTASKHGRLLYINYGLFGINDNVYLSKNKPQYSCVFMDPLGGLKEITVPFHFALNNKSGKKARDIHLLKKLKTFLREEEFDDEKLVSEIENMCSDLKTNEIRIQTIEMLMLNKNIIPDALLVAANCFIKKLNEYGMYAQYFCVNINLNNDKYISCTLQIKKRWNLQLKQFTYYHHSCSKSFNFINILNFSLMLRYMIVVSLVIMIMI